jgi:predicted PurR-regulated permease PerM
MISLYFFIKLEAIWLPVLKMIFTILLPFIVAAFITYLLHPIVEKIHEAGLHRGLAVFLIYFIFFGGIGYAIYKGLPEMIKQIKELAENVPALTEQYLGFIDIIQEKTSAWPDGIQDRVNQGIVSLEQRLDQFLSNILNTILTMFSGIVTIAIIPFISFYMLKDYNTLKKVVWFLTPRNWRKGGALLLRDIDKSLGSYIRGQILVCSVIGVLSTILFLFVDMKYPLLLGAIIGITNVIPYFGPIIGAIPALIIAFTISSKMVLITVILIFVLQFLEGNILSPLIVGKSLHMHPLVIMLSLFAGGEIGGILGMILAVPIVAILKVGLIHIRNYFGKRKAEDLIH